MGGGASKSHNNEVSNTISEQDRNEGKESEDYVPEVMSQPKDDPRGHTRKGNLAQFGNTLIDEDDNNSPRSSKDDDEFDCHPDNEHDEEYDDIDGDEEDLEEDNEEAMQLRMLFAQSAMSMDMDNEDLIFNLLYFGGDVSNFATMMNNAAEETVAAHSTGNTPYKLAPATALALKKLKIMLVTEDLVKKLNLQECLICQEEIENGNEIAELPGCSHCFHNECVLKWFTLQSWCPVCRTKILPDDDEGEHECADEQEADRTVVTKPIMLDDAAILNAKSNLSERFDEAADNRMEEVAA